MVFFLNGFVSCTSTNIINIGNSFKKTTQTKLDNKRYLPETNELACVTGFLSRSRILLLGIVMALSLPTQRSPLSRDILPSTHALSASSRWSLDTWPQEKVKSIDVRQDRVTHFSFVHCVREISLNVKYPLKPDWFIHYYRTPICRTGSFTISGHPFTWQVDSLFTESLFQRSLIRTLPSLKPKLK